MTTHVRTDNITDLDLTTCLTTGLELSKRYLEAAETGIYLGRDLPDVVKKIDQTQSMLSILLDYAAELRERLELPVSQAGLRPRS